MLPLGPNPIIHYVISHLAKNGFHDIIIIPGYLKDQVMGYVGDGSRFGVRVTYVVEPEGVTFGTAGSLKLAAHLLDETFLVVQADVITEIPLGDMRLFHSDHGGEVSLALTTVDDPSSYGVAILGDREEIVRFVEKPSPGTVQSNLVSTGFYILEPEVVDYINDEKWDFAKDLFPYLMRLGQHIFGFASNAFWVDVGELKGYLAGINWVLRNIAKDPPSDARIISGTGEPFYVQGQVSISSGARVTGPAWIEGGTSLGENTKITPGTVLKSNSQVMSDSLFEAGIAFHNVVIGNRCTIKSTIIGERAVIGNDVSIDRAIIGQGCHIGDRVKILPGSKLWPNTNAEEGTTIEGIIAVPRDKSFYFDTGLGQYSGILASSIQEFLDALKVVPMESLEYHIGRRDFEKWTKDVLGSVLLADNIRTLRRSQLKGEDLRVQLVDVVQEWAQRVSSKEQTPQEGSGDASLRTA
jgi:mannose-1-phosphate guanylyltransferase